MVKAGKIQKKSFFEVNSSLTSAKIQLYAASPQELNGKIVKIDLTRSLRGKSLELKLKVKAEGDKLNGEPTSLELAGSYIRRAFRKGADYVEDSFVAECKDNKVVIKPFMLTRNKVSREVRKAIRNTAKDYLLAYLKNRSSREIFTEIMTNKIQKELSLRLKKIYPLALCEIRMFYLLDSKAEVKMSEQKEASEARAGNKEKSEQNFSFDRQGTKQEFKKELRNESKHESKPESKKEKSEKIKGEKSEKVEKKE